MKIVFSIVFLISSLFANEQKEYLMNNIKSLIQKEEYLALAINKYILQMGKLPVESDKTIIEVLKEKKYLDQDFNLKNPYTNKNLKIIVDNNNIFIKGVIHEQIDDEQEDFKAHHKYLYNFYTDSKFRVNIIPPENIDKENLLKGSQVLYQRVQKDIVKTLTQIDKKFNGKDISDGVFLSQKNCEKGKYFYELKNEKLTFKYCKEVDDSIEVYQSSPILIKDKKDLKYINGNIGDTAFIKEGTEWVEYYFNGLKNEHNGLWTPLENSIQENNYNDNTDIEAQIALYIPSAKDFYIRQGGGCYLANGDIYCWGKNDFKKAGIQSYGQLDTTLKPDYVNTPVMLKTTLTNDTNWYNSPYRVKFEKMGMDRSNVCGITKIFRDKDKNPIAGGELYCNGILNSVYYEKKVSGVSENSILKKHIPIKNTGDELIYVKDIAMIEDVIALLSDDGDGSGKIYTMGKNYKGSLGVGRDDGFFQQNDPILISGDVKFKKIFALRDARTFGAISKDNKFYMWGERGAGWINKPTAISDIDFNENKIFVNTNEFILGGNNNSSYYKTKLSGTTTIVEAIDSSIDPISISYFKDEIDKEFMLYIDKNLNLQGTEALLNCKELDGTTDCDASSTALFQESLSFLNSSTLQSNNEKSNFTNVSIYKLDHQVKEVFEDFEIQIKKVSEDFEIQSLSGWNKTTLYEEGTNSYLGRFGSGSDANNYLNKTFDFGKENANKTVTIKYDFIQVGTWGDNNGNNQTECLYLYINSNSSQNTCITNGNQKIHNLSYSANLNSSGTINIGFSSDINGKYQKKINRKWVDSPNEEYWGIDNIEVSVVTKFTLEGWEKNDKDNEYTPLNAQNLTALADNGDKDRVPATTYLGKFQISHPCSATKKYEYFGCAAWAPNKGKCIKYNTKKTAGKICDEANVTPVIVSKTYDFPNYKNYEVEIEFDFYEIDSWDGERFEFLANEQKLAEDHFVKDNHDYLLDSNISGVSLQKNIGTRGEEENPQKYRYKLKSKIDAYGKLKLEFKTNLEFSGNVDSTVPPTLFKEDGITPIYGNYWSKFTSDSGHNEDINNESWGIDNVKIKIKEPNKKFVCAMTGVEQSSQMYCWGNVARSLPILNTSLYDTDKIESLNKLFFSQNQDINKQMSFDTYDTEENGMLFLKYPTYINGFDYPFYFR